MSTETEHIVFFTSLLLWSLPINSAAITTVLIRFFCWYFISKVKGEITKEMDLQVVSFTMAVNNHQCRLENNIIDHSDLVDLACEYSSRLAFCPWGRFAGRSLLLSVRNSILICKICLESSQELWLVDKAIVYEWQTKTEGHKGQM